MKVFQLIAAGVAARGVDPTLLLKRVNLSADDLLDPDGRFSRTTELRMWNEAAHLCQDEAFGILLSEQLPVDGLGAIGFAVRSSATVGEAFRRVVRYLRVFACGPTLELAEVGDLAILRHLPPSSGPPPSRHAIEFLTAPFVVLARHGVDKSVTPKITRFRHVAPGDLSTHLRIFGEALRFGQPQDEISFERSLLSQPQEHAEPALSEVLDQHLTAQMRAVVEETNFLGRIQEALTKELAQGEPTLLSTASRLRMSPRTLQRRLREDGTSLTAEIARVRTNLAVQYLTESTQAIGEVAYALGFSEVSTFHRAFKRWTGVTPAAYRRRKPPLHLKGSSSPRTPS